MIEKKWDSLLLEAALEAREKAYAPYSKFRVGAALLSEGGRVYTGCNIENAAYSPTLCAERTAFAKAISEGERKFKAIAVVGGREDQDISRLENCSPCGVCRQVMVEFCDLEKFEIVLGTPNGAIRKYTLGELLPLSFQL